MTKSTKVLKYPRPRAPAKVSIRPDCNADGEPIDYSVEFGYDCNRTYIFSFDSDVVDTVLLGGYGAPKSAAGDWIRNALRSHRNVSRSASAPVVVGLTFFILNKAFSYNLPPCVAAICIAGTHCLVTKVYPRIRFACEGPLPFELYNFLMDPRLRFVGVGAKAAAEWMRRECDVQISEALELRPLVDKAFTPRQPALSPFRLKGVGIEDLARVALGGVEVEKPPLPMGDYKWSPYYELNEDAVMYAVRDAYLACKMGERCLQVITGGGGN